MKLRVVLHFLWHHLNQSATNGLLCPLSDYPPVHPCLCRSIHLSVCPHAFRRTLVFVSPLFCPTCIKCNFFSAVVDALTKLEMTVMIFVRYLSEIRYFLIQETDNSNGVPILCQIAFSSFSFPFLVWLKLFKQFSP